MQAVGEEPRLPISNIAAEHVAKNIAVARKNFLFSCTPSGAQASANCFSIVQTAKLNGHNVHQYLAILLTELPKVESAEAYEQFLPWNMKPEDVKAQYQQMPIL